MTDASGTCSIDLGKADYGSVTASASTAGDGTPATATHVVAFRGPWSIVLGGGANTVAVTSSGAEISVTINATTQTRPAAFVTVVDVRGGSGDDTLTIGTVGVAVSFDGGAGTNALRLSGFGATASWSGTGGAVSGAGTAGVTFTNVSSIAATGSGNTLTGPSGDTTWNLTGPNAGDVASLSFTGFDGLTGAPGNKDTFVVGTGGSLSGKIDGGAAGFDTLVIRGSHSSVSSRANTASSGTITVDGTTIAYTGLEPITIDPDPTPAPPVAAITINGSSGDDHITIQNGSPGNLVASAPSMESITFPVPT